jgi:hypothetical protein
MSMAGRFAERRARRELELANRCPDCSHNWGEHAGSGNERDGVCGECAYELEHGYRSEDSVLCRRAQPTPAS